MSDAATSGGRAQPFYCPYCGEQDIRPDRAYRYHCRTCDRLWELTFLKLGKNDEEE